MYDIIIRQMFFHLLGDHHRSDHATGLASDVMKYKADLTFHFRFTGDLNEGMKRHY